jgi:hypothetical protein
MEILDRSWFSTFHLDGFGLFMPNGNALLMGGLNRTLGVRNHQFSGYKIRIQKIISKTTPF